MSDTHPDVFSVSLNINVISNLLGNSISSSVMVNVLVLLSEKTSFWSTTITSNNGARLTSLVNSVHPPGGQRIQLVIIRLNRCPLHTLRVAVKLSFPCMASRRARVFT